MKSGFPHTCTADQYSEFVLKPTKWTCGIEFSSKFHNITTGAGKAILQWFAGEVKSKIYIENQLMNFYVDRGFSATVGEGKTPKKKPF